MMIEARKGQIVIFLTEFGELEGTIGEVLSDRILVHFFKREANDFVNLEEGSPIKTMVHTKAGIKKMYPLIIEKNEHEIVIENAPTIEEKQVREYVRTACEKRFFIEYNKELLSAKTLDLSAGGVKFELNDKKNNFALGDFITAKYDEDELSGISLNAKIIKILQNGIFVAQFFDNNDNIISKVSKFCMGNID